MSDKLPEGRKLKSAVFVEAIASGTLSSVAVGAKEVLDFVPAVLLPDGDWVGADKGQRPDGIGVRQRMFGAGKPYVQRYFVPWANVSSLMYGE